jgi:hypothetical protein
MEKAWQWWWRLTSVQMCKTLDVCERVQCPTPACLGYLDSSKTSCMCCNCYAYFGMTVLRCLRACILTYLHVAVSPFFLILCIPDQIACVWTMTYTVTATARNHLYTCMYVYACIQSCLHHLNKHLEYDMKTSYQALKVRTCEVASTKCQYSAQTSRSGSTANV